MMKTVSKYYFKNRISDDLFNYSTLCVGVKNSVSVDFLNLTFNPIFMMQKRYYTTISLEHLPTNLIFLCDAVIS